MKPGIIILIFFLVCAEMVFSQDIRITYYHYQNTYLQLNMYPYDEPKNSAEIESFIADYEEGEELGEIILDKIVVFPQISGIQNIELQSRLNEEFRGRLINLEEGDDIPVVLMSVYIDSGKTSEIPFDANKVQLVRRFDHHKLTEMNGQLSFYTEVNVGNEFIQITEFDGQDGNIGAHPNFSSSSVVLDIHTGEKVTFGSMYEGNYMEVVGNVIDTLDFLGGDDELYAQDCMGGSIREAWKSSINDETRISNITDEFVILSRDARDFGCPEIMRGELEVKIPRKMLEIFLKD